MQSLATRHAIRRLALWRKPLHVCSVPLYLTSSDLFQSCPSHQQYSVFKSFYSRQPTPIFTTAYVEQPIFTNALGTGSASSSGAGGGGGRSSSSGGGGGRSEGPATIPLAAAEVRGEGQINARYIQKADVAGVLGVAGRDLRAIDASFRMSGGSLLPREKVIIVHLLHVRVLICADYVLVFDPLNAHVERFIPALATRLASRTHPMPFEFRAIEAVLVEVCSTLSQSLGTLVPSADTALDRLSRADLSGGLGFETSLDQLLPLQSALHDFNDRVEATRDALVHTLASDEDLSLMYLSTYASTGHRRRVDEHDEAEMMLENYVKQVDAIRSEVRSTLRAIKATENVTQIRLDAMRNRVLRLEVLLNLAAVSVSTSALVAAAFGMNLKTGLEEHPHAFAIVSAIAVGGSFATFRGTLAYLRWRRIFW